MNRYIIFALLALASVYGAQNDPAFDFIEQLMHDGKYPEYFAEKRDHQVAPLYDQQEELYQSFVQDSKKPTTIVDKKDCPDEICKFPHIPKIVTKTRAILSKNRAFTKVLAVAKKAIGKAIKVTRSLVGTKAKIFAKDPKQMVKNAMYLKAFAKLNADKLYSRAAHMGALGGLLKDMTTKSKKTPLEQYADSMERLSEENQKGGMGQYTLKAMAMAMLGKGLVSMGPLEDSGSGRQYVKIDPSDLGLVRHFPLLTQLATTVGYFVRTLQILDKKAMFALKGRTPAASPLTQKDFKRLFRTTCWGAKGNVCFKHKTKKSCDAHAAHGCDWLGAWDGRLADQVLIGTPYMAPSMPGTVGAWV